MHSIHIETNTSARPSRPLRLRIQDELGRTRTLDYGQAHFLTVTGETLPKGTTASEGTHIEQSNFEIENVRSCHSETANASSEPLLLFGLGPEPDRLAAFIASWRGNIPASCVDAPVYWIECPDFEVQMPETWQERIPAHWTRIRMPELAVHGLEPFQDENTLRCPELAVLLDRIKTVSPAHIWRYDPGIHFFSTFWGRLLGAVQAKLIGYAAMQEPSRTVLLPGDTGDLLTIELEQAVAQTGFAPVRLLRSGSVAHEHANAVTNLPMFLRHERPALFLSVNMRGLDADGETFRLLRACGVPVALWFVDNPWHILSALRVPWWREAALFVTDASFIAPLRQYGAGFVRHLPLGSWMQPATTASTTPLNGSLRGDGLCGNPLRLITFVGRSAFPAHDRFFSGCRVPESLLNEGLERLHTASPPHAHWWEQRLGIESFWPGNAIRQAGYAAEYCSSQRRHDWLQAAAPLGLTVFGDDAWKDALPPNSDVRPPLDYYGSLPKVYGEARYSLNVTSLLLPEGLTQRHFDVWTAGGFLLSDATPGLNLFPKELVEPMTVTTPRELLYRISSVERDSHLRQHLIEGWKACLRREHTYTTRFETLLRELSTDPHLCPESIA